MKNEQLLKLKIGDMVKMQPFIDSDLWTVGQVTSVDKDWIYIKWSDVSNILQHYHSETKDFTLLSESEIFNLSSFHKATL